MKKLLKKIGTAVALSALFLLGATSESKAECSFATFTPSSMNTQPGALWSAYSTFHENNNLTRKVELVQSGGDFNNSNITVSFDNANVISTGAGNPSVVTSGEFNLSNPPDGNHTFQLDGKIPAGTACNKQCNIIVTVYKKVLGVWGQECTFTYIVRTKTTATLSVSGAAKTCDLQSQAYVASGGGNNAVYTWTSSNSSFQITNTGNASFSNATITPTIPGSNTTITVTSVGPDYCGVASYTFNLYSVSTTITLTPTHIACAQLGSSLSVNATNIAGATYYWSMKSADPLVTTWTNLGSTTVNTKAVPTPTAYGNYIIRCYVDNLICHGNYAYLNVKWCRPNLPGQISCCYNPEKREIGPDANHLIQNAFAVMPNPSSGVFQIESISEINAVKVFDLSGRLVKEFESLNGYNYSMDLSELKDGIYLIEVSGENYTEKQKIIKSN